LNQPAEANATRFTNPGLGVSRRGFAR